MFDFHLRLTAVPIELNFFTEKTVQDLKEFFRESENSCYRKMSCFRDKNFKSINIWSLSSESGNFLFDEEDTKAA